MRRRLLLTLLLTLVAMPAYAGPKDGNRLTYLDRTDPYYVGLTFPKLVTPQWVGEPGVEAVVVLAIDDMRGPDKWEAYLRPILERLKKIDGRAAVSIMTCQVDPKHPHLQTWLKEGVSLETHTFDHPCPLFKGDFDKSKATFDRAVDLLADVPNNRPVAFRTPCCDSLNTVTPRFFDAMFNRTTPRGRFLSLDSSIFNLFTPDDPDLPRDLVTDRDGRGRFAKYQMADRSFVNFVENYPYPYVVNKLCWEFPCVTPSDWQAQHLQKPNNPLTVRDWQAALDCTVIKQGVFCLVFHPHGWIKNEQILELIDYAQAKHGKKVKFLTFREALERLDKNVLGGQSLRAADGRDNGVRLLDLNNDGYLDVVIGNERTRRTRLWSPRERRWLDGDFAAAVVTREGTGDAGVRFGVFQPDGQASLLVRTEKVKGAWHFVGDRWVADQHLRDGLTTNGPSVWTAQGGNDRGARLLDIDGDGRCEFVIGNDRQSAVFRWDDDAKVWLRSAALPSGAALVDERGRDRGVRFVDVDGDGFLDLVWSDDSEFGLHLYDPVQRGWTRRILGGKRGESGELPPFVRNGVDNGAWFHDRALYVINEHTHLLKDFVDRRSFNDLLSEVEPTAKAPAASAALMKARPGFVVEQMAAEPLVQSPIALAFGADGKLWVVEMGDYPLGADGKGKPGGRVKFLESTRGDGHFDKATLFLDNLSIPTGVTPWRKGVLVTCAPDILYAEDTDGDGKADKIEKLFTGFREGNPQHRLNGLWWGVDNWLYGANGDSGGRVRSAKTGATVDIRGHDFRLRPDTGEFEVVTGQSQYGRCHDDWGTWFGGNNSNPAWQFALDDHYLRRNPHLAPPDPRSRVPEGTELPRVYPVSRTMPRFNDFHTANRFTSACGITIYRDDLFGPQFAGNLFVCEPVHDLVSRMVLTPEGSTFVGRRAVDERSSEFLASADNWTRLTMAVTGPDGALWVPDMYRHVIEHPEWIPKETQKRLDLRAGHDMGRIYRVYPANAKPRAIPRLDKLDAAGLVAALDSPSGWQRDTAQRLLIERQDRSALRKLEEMALVGGRPEARLHALCTLDGLGALQHDIVLHTLSDKHPGLRRHAVRLSERLLRQFAEVGPAVLKLADDLEPHVRMQVAYTLGEWDDPRAGEALGRLAVAAAGDRYLTAAVLSSLNARNFDAVLKGALSPSRGPSPELLQELLRQADAFGKKQATVTLLDAVAKPAAGGFAAWQFAALGGFLDGLERRRSSLNQLSQRDAETKRAVAALAGLFAAARPIAEDAKQPADVRAQAVRLLGRGPDRPNVDLDRLTSLLGPKSPPEVQSAAIGALGRIRDAGVPDRLLQGWAGYGPAMRAQVLELLGRRDDWLAAALSAAERGTLPPAEIDAARRQQWLGARDAALRARAAKLFGGTSTDRQKVLDSYQPVVKLTGDAKNGQTLFAKHCATCHKLAGTGGDVGPDLSGLADKPLDYLLTAVLDPNRAVEARYVAYVAETTGGLRLTGIIANESGNRLTLTAADGKSQTVLRSDLESLTSTGKSLMPEGLEKELPQQQMADLLAHVKANAPPPKPKQFAGNIPTPVRAAPDGSLTLRGSAAAIFGPTLVFEPRKYGNLGYWMSADDHATWTIEVPKAGPYEVWFEWACDPAAVGNEFVLRCGAESFSGKVSATAGWGDYRRAIVGEITLSAGSQTIDMRAAGPIKGALTDLKEIWLVPVKE
jgi:putative membrane-bound dehydrogenase-like protein